MLFQSGFRVFFFAATVYSIVSMAFWMFFYVAGGNIFVAMPLTVWHGHEMIFGFTMAVVAGFLLTAVSNWTGLATATHRDLLWLVVLWLLARICAFAPKGFPLWGMVIGDLVFTLYLMGLVIRPILRTKQYKQSAVLSKLVMLFLASGFFYLALFTDDLIGQRRMLKFAVYVVISLILTIGRRIIPFFVEKGVGYPVTLRNSQILDYASLVLIVVLCAVDVFGRWPGMVAGISFLLLGVHALRLQGWWTPGILQKPLLWVLFVGYGFVILGFLLKSLGFWIHTLDDAAMHAWTAGGIGVFIVGMMARVSWGHTGRNIAQPPRGLSLIFGLIFASAVVRTILPVCCESLYLWWIGLSQLLWMVSFIIFLCCYAQVWFSPRVDGKAG